VFSLAPLMFIAIAIAGLVFGSQAARGEIVDELASTVGRPAAQAIEDILRQNNDTGGNTLASIVGLLLLLLGASGVFVELEDALNTIWKVPTEKGATFLAFLRDRVLSFTLVLATGFLLLVSLILSAALRMSDTSSKNPVASTRVNDSTRSRRKARNVAPFSVGTFQMVFSASSSSTNTPEAPSRSNSRPTIEASVLPPVSLFCRRMSSIAWAAGRPTVLANSSTISPRAACEPNTSPAMAMAMNMSGASEN